MTENVEPRQSPEGLATRLLQRIRESGPLTFAEFMEAALYDPEHGFYAKRSIGEDSDFVTSPHVSPAFGVLVAKQIEEFWELLDKPSPFWVVEAGAGDGTLAGQVLDFLTQELREATRYVTVERSETARRSMDRLDVRSVPDIQEVPSGMVGCVVANELLDNLPFHRLRARESRLAELYVGLEGDRLAIIEGPVSSPRLEEMASNLAPGQEVIVQADALDFVDQAAALLDKGYIWLVDFGFTGQERAAVPHGYRSHRLVTDILSEPGSADITAGVNFDALADHARAAGHSVWGPVSQREALIALGFRRLDEDARKRQVDAAAAGRGVDAMRIYSARSRATLLVDPMSLGGFLVLCVGVGVVAPPASVRKVG